MLARKMTFAHRVSLLTRLVVAFAAIVLWQGIFQRAAIAVTALTSSFQWPSLLLAVSRQWLPIRNFLAEYSLARPAAESG